MGMRDLKTQSKVQQPKHRKNAGRNRQELGRPVVRPCLPVQCQQRTTEQNKIQGGVMALLHRVVFYGAHAEAMRDLGDLMGFKVIEEGGVS